MKTPEETLTECYLKQIGCENNDYVRKNYIEQIKEGGTNYIFNAMQEYAQQIASLAWDAGYDKFGEMVFGNLGKQRPTKEQFLNSIFNKP